MVISDQAKSELALWAADLEDSDPGFWARCDKTFWRVYGGLPGWRDPVGLAFLEVIAQHGISYDRPGAITVQTQAVRLELEKFRPWTATDAAEFILRFVTPMWEESCVT